MNVDSMLPVTPMKSVTPPATTDRGSKVVQEDEIGTLTGIVDIPLSGAERIKSWSRHQNCKRIG